MHNIKRYPGIWNKFGMNNITRYFSIWNKFSRNNITRYPGIWDKYGNNNTTRCFGIWNKYDIFKDIFTRYPVFGLWRVDTAWITLQGLPVLGIWYEYTDV